MKSRIKLIILPLLAFLLISCNLLAPGGPVRGASTPDLVQTLTAMAPTGMATAPTQLAGTTVAPTSQPTSTPVTGFTPAAATPTQTSNPVVTRCDWAQFLGDVTIPDGTQMDPGKAFVKKWRLKNIGTCTWDTQYHLVFNSGSAMNGPSSVSLPEVVSPGSTVDVLVNLTAPTNPGNYTGNWKLANGSGATFGVGSDAQGTFYVQIKVAQPPTPAPGMTRINFLANATSAQVADTINGGQTKRYVLTLMGGQVLMASVGSPNADVFLRIYGAKTGEILLDAGMGAAQTSWQGRLPSTQDYVIEAISRGGNANILLNLIVPENIVFSPGANSGSYSFPIHARETHTFLLHANAGQTMTLTLSPSDKTVLLAFYGYQNGEPYQRIEVGQTSWSGQVPVTQDYVVQVVSVIDSDTNFTLSVKIQ